MTNLSDPNPTTDQPLESPIVTCIDFSEDSKAALVWAGKLAETTGRPMVLLHIVHDMAAHPGFYHPDKADHLEPMQDVAQSMMSDFLALMKSQNPELASIETADVQLIPGLPATRIVEVAGLLKADLLVLGGNGMASHSRKRLGSVVERVAELSTIPIAIIKSDDAGPISKKEIKNRKKKQKKEQKMLKKLLGISGLKNSGESVDE